MERMRRAHAGNMIGGRGNIRATLHGNVGMAKTFTTTFTPTITGDLSVQEFSEFFFSLSRFVRLNSLNTLSTAKSTPDLRVTSSMVIMSTVNRHCALSIGVFQAINQPENGGPSLLSRSTSRARERDRVQGLGCLAMLDRRLFAQGISN